MRSEYAFRIKHRTTDTSETWQAVINNEVVSAANEKDLREAVLKFIDRVHPGQDIVFRMHWTLVVQDESLSEKAAVTPEEPPRKRRRPKEPKEPKEPAEIV